MKEQKFYNLGIGILIAAVLIYFLGRQQGKKKGGKLKAKVNSDFLDPGIDFSALARRAYEAFNGLFDSLDTKTKIVIDLNALNAEELKQTHNEYLTIGENTLYTDLIGERWIWTWNNNYTELRSRLEKLQLT